jgi:hypothetical protein
MMKKKSAKVSRLSLTLETAERRAIGGTERGAFNYAFDGVGTNSDKVKNFFPSIIYCLLIPR